MTTANLMNVPSVNGGYATQADASKKLQDESLKVAEVFAGLMNPNVNFSNNVVDETSSNMDVKTDSNQSAANSYERYSYKDNKIDEAKTQDVSEKLEESSETLEQAEQDVVNAIAEEYGVSEEEINKLLEEMGLSVLDLLNPQNLVNFIVQLTGVASGEELLLDESFLSVMETLDNLAEGLMKELNVDMEGLQELIDQMDVVNTEIPASFQENLDVALEQTNVQEATETTGKETQAEEVVIEVEVEKQEEKSEVKTNTIETEDTTVTQNTKEDTSFTGNQDSKGGSLLNHQSNENETIVTQQTNVNNMSQVTDMSQTQLSSYMSADTVQIMEQIVQQMRVTISAETTSMEMQLNPENLGKVYVNISSEEGVVNAQFHATNEVVKEALEAQIATLRENLNQAGVKVDAIEVTIASHEFERNLEQNQQNPEENKEVQEASTNKRRNISIDSLDELSGVMTEEESLVAQMMKDNGNSVDFTA